MKIEHISPEQPYRLKSENCAQIIKDNSGDISHKPDHISPCISPEENAQNHAQNEELRRSGDSGDICSQRIIAITMIITQFLILWHMITDVFFLQFLILRIFPISIVVRPMF